MSKKAFDSIQELREVFLAERYTLLSMEYKNNKSLLKLLCPNGHYVEISYHRWRGGIRCKYCATKGTIINGMKKCSGCGEWRSIKKFPDNGVKRNKNRYGIYSYCIYCEKPREKREIPEELKPYIIRRYDGKSVDDHLPKRAKLKLDVACQWCGKEYRTNAYYIYESRRTRCPSCVGKNLWEDEENKKRMLSMRDCEEYREKLSKGLKKHYEENPEARERSSRVSKKRWEQIRGFKYEDYADEWEMYKKKVYSLSESNYKKYIDIVNPNRVERGRREYHLDHIYSVLDGFKNNIPVHIISNPYNMQMLPFDENLRKDCLSDINKDELFRKYFEEFINE